MDFEITNPKHDGRGGITCLVDYPPHGVIEYTARQDDPDPTGRKIWAAVSARDDIAPADPVLVTKAEVAAERDRRLANGFDYDFGDGRGVHRIATTESDMRGWDEVSVGAQAAINLGSGSTAFGIVTETGPATLTALEWQSVLAAATAFRQPIWAASFVLQASDPIPADYTDDSHWLPG